MKNKIYSTIFSGDIDILDDQNQRRKMKEVKHVLLLSRKQSFIWYWFIVSNLLSECRLDSYIESNLLIVSKWQTSQQFCQGKKVNFFYFYVLYGKQNQGYGYAKTLKRGKIEVSFTAFFGFSVKSHFCVHVNAFEPK